MKKRIVYGICTVLLFAACILSAGCGKIRKSTDTDSQGQGGEAGTPGTSSEENTPGTSGGGTSGYGMPEEDVQYIEGWKSLKGKEMLSTNSGIMTITDVETGYFMYVCSIPGCTHAGEACPARKYNGLCPMIYNDRVYTFLNNDDNYTALYSMNIDGTDIQECCNFGEYSSYLGLDIFGSVRVEDKLYFVIDYFKQSFDTDSGYVKQEFDYICLYEYDLTTEEVKKYFQSENAYQTSGGRLYYSAGRLAFDYSIYEKSPEDIGYTTEEYMNMLSNGSADALLELWNEMGWKHIIVEVDVANAADGEVNMYDDEAGYRALWGYQNGKLLLGSEEDNEELVWYDMRTQKVTDIPETSGFRGAAQLNGVIVVNCKSPDTFGQKYLMFFEDREEPAEWTRTREDMDFSIECSGDEILYISWRPTGKDSVDTEWTYEYVNREEFLQ